MVLVCLIHMRGYIYEPEEREKTGVDAFNGVYNTIRQ
jgi:hypothetical protein